MSRVEIGLGFFIMRSSAVYHTSQMIQRLIYSRLFHLMNSVSLLENVDQEAEEFHHKVIAVPTIII